MPKNLRQASRFLHRNDRIAAYLATIERNTRLLRAIRNILPPPLDQHCLHAALDAGELTLVTDSPVWASRLRFFAPELENTLATRYGSIATRRVHIQPRATIPTQTPGETRKYRLSARTRQHLMEAAGGIEDAQIAAALRRLAKAGAGDY